MIISTRILHIHSNVSTVTCFPFLMVFPFSFLRSLVGIWQVAEIKQEFNHIFFFINLESDASILWYKYYTVKLVKRVVFWNGEVCFCCLLNERSVFDVFWTRGLFLLSCEREVCFCCLLNERSVFVSSEREVCFCCLLNERSVFVSSEREVCFCCLLNERSVFVSSER